MRGHIENPTLIAPAIMPVAFPRKPGGTAGVAICNNVGKENENPTLMVQTKNIAWIQKGVMNV